MPADQLRNRTVGSKMTESEYEQLVAMAEREGLTLGEWCRQVLLARVDANGGKKPNATEQTLLAEVMALRTILLNALFKLGLGEAFTTEEMQELIQRADGERFDRAQERLAAATGVGVKQQWGRNSHAGERLNRRSVWTWAAAFLALASMVGICVYRYFEVWTPLQRFYVKTYIRCGFRSLAKFSRTDSYWLVSVVGKKGGHSALNEEVMQVKTETGEAGFALTPEAVRAGDMRLVVQKVQCDNAKLHDFLGRGSIGTKPFRTS